MERRRGTLADYVFPSRIDHTDHLSTGSVHGWSTSSVGVGLRREEYGTHSLRWTKETLHAEPTSAFA